MPLQCTTLAFLFFLEYLDCTHCSGSLATIWCKKEQKHLMQLSIETGQYWLSYCTAKFIDDAMASCWALARSVCIGANNACYCSSLYGLFRGADRTSSCCFSPPDNVKVIAYSACHSLCGIERVHTSMGFSRQVESQEIPQPDKAVEVGPLHEFYKMNWYKFFVVLEAFSLLPGQS